MINRWKFNVGGPFALTIISIISISLCVLCGLSCFYNYRIHHGHGPPFIACGFCPECLFPSVEQNQMPVNTLQLDDSDIKGNDEIPDGETPSHNAKVFGHFEIEQNPDDGEVKRPHDKYKVPDLNLSDLPDK